jgi:hypothetical protein
VALRDLDGGFFWIWINYSRMNRPLVVLLPLFLSIAEEKKHNNGYSLSKFISFRAA